MTSDNKLNGFSSSSSKSKEGAIAQLNGNAGTNHDDAKKKKKEGYSASMAGFLIVAQMAGAGFISLPAALANTGWFGVPMLLLFCIMVGFATIRLGDCWNILEERWPEKYTEPARQPYMDMAYQSLGKHGRNFTLFCVVVSQFGGSAVFIILISQLINILAPQLSTCWWVLIVGAIITPCTFPGTPKDFWVGPIVAVASTYIACAVIFVQVLLDAPDAPEPQYTNPTVMSFANGYGAILFAFGGSSAYPTIQNDMAEKDQFWKSVILAFLCILSLYLPVCISGYAVFGSTVNSNIMIQVSQGIIVKLAMTFQIVNLLGSYVIGFNTVTQAVEDLFNIDTDFNWKRVVSRSILVWLQVLICLAVPDFSLILNLIGASTMTVCSFVLPPLMYLILCSSGPKHTQKEIPLWMRVLVYEIVIVGTIGGAISTVTAFYAMVTTAFSASCFTDFSTVV